MGKLRYVLLALLLISKSALACTVTLNPGTNVITTAISSSSANDVICLNTGTYTETNTIQLKDGQTLKGLGSLRTDTTINSSATYPITFAASADYVTLYNFYLLGNSISSPDVGIYADSNPHLIIWALLIERVRMPIGIYSSDYSALWDVYTSDNGWSNAAPDPSVFIYDSDYLEILYGYFEGASNGPGGDGEIACWGSTNLLIDGANVAYSGAGSIYFVDCDDSTVQNATIYGGDEWGLDIVSGATAGQDGAPLYLDGTANFTAIGNTISNHYWGASVFDEAGNGPGTFTNNTFNYNNTSHDVDCHGINVIGNLSNITTSGNTAVPATGWPHQDQEKCNL